MTSIYNSTTTTLLVDTTSTRKIVFLPVASTVGAGRLLWIKDISGNAATNGIYISTIGMDRIENRFAPSTLFALVSSSYGSVLMTSDGILNWYFLQHYYRNAVLAVAGLTNIRVLIIRTIVFNSIDTLLQTARTSMGLSATLTITIITSASETGSTLLKSNYDVVIIYSDYIFSQTSLGTPLNTFIAAGGSVIMATFCWNQTLPGFTYTNSTFVYSGTQLNGSQASFTATISHPITTGVGTSMSIARPFDNGNITLQSGATLIATAASGYPLIATTTIGSARQVGFNSYIDLSFADTNGNFQKLVCRAIYWCVNLI